jgi:YHS domain-containing protein
MAAINPRSVGETGGCNPIRLPSRIVAGLLRVPLAALSAEAWRFGGLSAAEEIDPVCGMRVRLNQAETFASYQGHTYTFCSERCRQVFDAAPAAYVPGGR